MSQGSPSHTHPALELWPQLFGFAMQLLRDRTAAEDLCQEAYLRFFGMSEVDTDRPLRPLLFTILRNLVRSAARRSGPYFAGGGLEVEPIDDRSSNDPAFAAETAEESAIVDAALSRMPPAWRAALYLKDGLELSHREIADILGATDEVVRVSLHRARLRVRVILKSHIAERSDA